VVDDNPTNRKVAELHLHALGFACRTAADAEEAMALLKTESFEIVLMDCEMPGMDGFEATRRIREQEVPGTRQTILALTAHSVEGARERAAAAGMDGFLSKPLRRESLNAALNRWLQVRAESMREEEIAFDAHTWEGLEYLESVSGPGAIAELVEDFSRDAPARLERMAEALAHGNLEGLSHLAHDLKSNAATLGLTDLSGWAARIEQSARDLEAGESGSLLEVCRNMLPAVLRALRNRIPAV
jgi:CheY-like chemotaxis protein